jgi:hypothetical protein
VTAARITAERTRGEGLLVLTALVAGDGMTWYESRKFMGYTVAEARRRYREAIAAEGWRIVPD